jgi:hypothetical protein
MLRHSRIGFALLGAFAIGALVLGFAGGAKATSFNLGNISGPGSFSFGNSKDLGPFTDKVHFTIDPGVSLIFSADAVNHTWRHGGIYNMDGTLSDASGVILNGDGALVNPPFPYPDAIVSFQNIVLGPGHYFLSIFGNSESDVGVWNDYTGNIQFAATPLPAALLMMLTALGSFGFLGWRRKGKAATS